MFSLSKDSIFAENYKLIRRRGIGGFSEVWEAEDLRTKTIVAIKIFAPDKGLDEDGLEVFKEEYRKCHELRHNHILPIKYYSEYESRPYLLMPLCKKGSLRNKIVSRYEFPETDIATLIFQIASALSYVHKKGIIHQDIKPHNILIDDDDDYQLTDFGSSSTRQTVMRTIARTDNNAPPSYNSFTPAYAPPEVNIMLPHPPGDIFSLGVTLFEVAHNNLPYEKMGEAIKNKAQMPAFPPNYTTGLKQLITQCMSAEYNERPTAEELAQTAQHYLKYQIWPNEPQPIVKEPVIYYANETPEPEEIITNNPIYTEALNEYAIPTTDTNNDIPDRPTEDISDSLERLYDKNPEIFSLPLKENKVPNSAETIPNPPPQKKKAPGKALWLIPLLILTTIAGAWFISGKKQTQTQNLPWADPSMANTLPEKYRKPLEAYYALTNKESLYKFYDHPNNWVNIDFQMSDGEYQSLAIIMRNKQNPNQEKSKIWILHFDQNGQVKQQPEPYLLDCNQCQTLTANDKVVRTVCTVQQGQKNTPRLIGSNYISTQSEPKLVVYKHPDKQNIAYCWAE